MRWKRNVRRMAGGALGAWLALSGMARADLVITEVMSDSDHPGGAGNGDWWELTNTGGAAVDLEGYIWNDSNDVDDDEAEFPAITIEAGESILIVDEPSDNITAWHDTVWGLGAGVRAFSKDDFIKDGNGDSFSGLSSGGDSVYLWDDAENLVTSVTFGVATTGKSFEWDEQGNSLSLSADGENGAFVAPGDGDGGTGTDIASPGTSVATSSPAAPELLGPYVTYWRDGAGDLSNSSFLITTSDDNQDAITITASSKPAWLTVNDQGDGTATLSGTPAAAGVHTFEVSADDTPAGTGPTTETYTLYVFSGANPVLVNEYNAVGDGDFLNGGSAESDDDGGTASDSHFGRIEGNGGDWLELVVVGDGSAGSTVDMRGWTVEVFDENWDSETVKLSNADYWSAVPAGTILTLTEDNTEQGGLDTEINRVSDLSDSGRAWTNIWLHDPFFIDQSASDFGGGIAIDNDDTKIALRDAADTLVYGPCGEGVPTQDEDPEDTYPETAPGVNSEEVYKLEANPVPAADAMFGGHNDGSSSTFGAPNEWSGGADVQDFTPYVTGNTPPSFTSSPQRHAVGGSYSYTVTTTDANGQNAAISAAAALPAFLTLTDDGDGTATLASNRSLLAGDVGTYTIELLADDQQGSLSTTPHTFTLTVHDPAPVVILNEYNAVDSANFLNGGTTGSDDDGGTASDSHFGRIEGNGGDWFELVVVGDGTAGTTDLRGFSIEVGTTEDDGSFDAGSLIVLSTDSYWAAVPNGTILTFTEDNTANGGLDTDIERVDNLASDGYIWTNVWLGDTTRLGYTDENTNGYMIGGGLVSGLGIDNDDTQFIIADASGNVVFGIAGEGVAPTGGVSDTEVFELEDDPSPSITVLDEAGTSTPGYDDGASGSTFGSPNQWHDGDGGPIVTQDFSAYVSSGGTPLDNYLAGYGLTGDDAESAADPDGDFASNLEEFAFGTDPNDNADQPGWNTVVREESGGGSLFFSFSFLHRTGGTWAGDTYSVDSITYDVDGSLDMTAWSETVVPADNPGDLPAPPDDYAWKTFRLHASIDERPEGFLQVLVTTP